MAINRGYKPAEQVIMDDWYDPQLEMLAQVGATEQKKSDEAYALAAAIAEKQFNYLSGDTEKAKGVYDEIRTTITKLSEGAMGDGDLRSVRKDIERYGRDLQRRFAQDGDVGRMQANYTGYNAWAKKVDEMAAKQFGKDGILSDHAEALKAKVLRDYSEQGGIGANDPKLGYQDIKLMNPAASVDITGITEGLGTGYIPDSYKNAEIDPNTGEVKQGAMWRDKGRIWRKTGQSATEVKADDIFKDLMYGIMQRKDLAQYRNQLHGLGIDQFSMDDIFITNPETGEKVLNQDHYVVQEAKRGASKFGFKAVDFSDDMKFDEWDKIQEESRLRMKEKNSEKQILVLESISKETKLTPAEVSKLSTAAKAGKEAANKTIGDLQIKLKYETDPDEKVRLQDQINKSIAERNKFQAQEDNSNAKLQKIEKLGGVDAAAEAKALGVTVEDYTAMMRGEKPLPTIEKTTTVIAGDKLSGEGRLVTEQVTVPKFAAAKAKYNKNVTYGNDEYSKNIEQRSILLPTADTKLAKKVQLVKDAIKAGSVNFIQEDGTSFNNTDLGDALANGEVELHMMTNPINGKVGWQVSVTAKGKTTTAAKKFKTMVGTVEGPENQTMMADLDVELEDMATTPGISTDKADQLRGLAGVFRGGHAQASTAGGQSTGYGTVDEQVKASDINMLQKDQETEGYIHLPYGLAARFIAQGDGTFKPKIFKVVNGVGGSGYVRLDDADVGIDGVMSMEDFYSWLGKAPQLQKQAVGPKYVSGPTVAK